MTVLLPEESSCGGVLVEVVVVDLSMIDLILHERVIQVPFQRDRAVDFYQFGGERRGDFEGQSLQVLW